MFVYLFATCLVLADSPKQQTALYELNEILNRVRWEIGQREDESKKEKNRAKKGDDTQTVHPEAVMETGPPSALSTGTANPEWWGVTWPTVS